MKIRHLRTNHLENPLGFRMEQPTLSWIAEDTPSKRQFAARILLASDAAFEHILFDSGKREDISSLGFTPPIELSPCTRYHWKVQVWGDAGDQGESEAAWFETAKRDQPWLGRWLGTPYGESVHPLYFKGFQLDKDVREARVYITGLGLYELYVNGERMGEDVLAPFFTDYNNIVQYQTYDVTDALRQGDNAIGAMLGNGWYKGRFGFMDKLDKLYGDSFHLLAELHIHFEDGSSRIIGTDTDWLCGQGPVLESSIYDGEVYDARRETKDWALPTCDLEGFVPAPLSAKTDFPLMERISPPVTITETLKPTLLVTPAGETVLDFGQVMTGWVSFHSALPADGELFMQFGELLQHGNFYNENLRTAKQEYRFISAGDRRIHSPRFTFYGFRFVKVTGLDSVNPEDFTGCVIHSRLDFTGELETSHAKVNKLIENILWGQRGNFLDVPTDCPQRDERMGWTGDAQVFAATAGFNMETPAFFAKFMLDMELEQKDLGGSVPHVVPDILGQINRIHNKRDESGMFDIPCGSSAWADAATVIPWTLYLYYGDKALLAQQYTNMKMWIDYIHRTDEEHCGGKRLWTHGFHFSDWLALDNAADPKSPFGRTDIHYIASCYYRYSALLTAKAAAVLGHVEDAARYERLAEEVRVAIEAEYITPAGRLAIDTQTAHVLAFFLGISPRHNDRLARDLARILDKSNRHLTTGFVGTAYLCNVLSEHGLNEYAYTLLLNEDYPSWLYEVNMGATTVWERWNSVLPDGLVSDTGMNSMNHYAYGAVAEWMYRYMCGLNPREESPGFKQALIRPLPDPRLDYAKARYRSAAGVYRSGWQRTQEGYRFEVEVPFDAEAEFHLPGTPLMVSVNGTDITREAGEGPLALMAGNYVIEAAYPA